MCLASLLPIVAGGSLLVSAGGLAGDWPQYRGPNHDGISTEVIRTNWTAKTPQRLWKISLGQAWSSLTVQGGRVFTQVERSNGLEPREYCVALDASTGKELWATDVEKADYLNGYDGARSTPSVIGDRVYVYTSWMQLYCLAVATGKVLWSHDLASEYNGTVIPWNNASSPLVIGDRVFVNHNGDTNRIAAFNRFDGTLAWRNHSNRTVHATPIATTLHGVLQVIFQTREGLIAVNPDDGAALWRFNFPQNSTSAAASPVVAGDRVYCSAAYGTGAGAALVSLSSGVLSAAQAWKTKGANMNHWATPVYHEGYLYGVYGQGSLRLACVDAASGQEMWQQTGVGYGSVLKVNNLLVVLTEDGDLVLVEPRPDAYREIDRVHTVNGLCWNNPAISQGRIYVRSQTEAAAYDIAPTVVPRSPLKLEPGLSGSGRRFQLVIGTQNGSPIDAVRAAGIQLLTTPDLSAARGSWSPTAPDPILVDGRLRFEESLAEPTGRRYFRVIEP